MESVEGKLLVAAPHLLDPNFYRAVVLVVRHDEEGAYGLILNRPTNQHIGPLMEMLLETPCDFPGCILCGGPVEGPLVVLHNQECDADICCGHNLYLSSCQERVKELVHRSDVRLLMFDGYAGWGPNQLDEELRRGGWLVADLNPQELFDSTDLIWENCIQRIGRDILSCQIHEDRIPRDPSMN
jgi:putative transcriptional regulator